jgi:hypothetical protein
VTKLSKNWKIFVVPRRVRKELVLLTATAGAKLDKAKATQLPIFSERLIRYVMATPSCGTVSGQRGGGEPARVYSSAYNRSHHFTHGSNFSRRNVKYAAGADGYVAVWNRCQPSMSGGKLYRPCFLLQMGTEAVSMTWAHLRRRIWCHCTCKNGDAAGNCAHLAALFVQVGRLQGVLEEAAHPQTAKLRALLAKESTS